MGKRELLLVGAFIVLGILTYQLTAPASEPSRAGLSISRILQDLRTRLSSDDSRAERRLSASRAATPGIAEIRIADFFGAVRVIGEERPDVSADLTVEVFGPDAVGAQRSAADVTFELGEEAGAMTVVIRYPPGLRRPRGNLTLRVPHRLRARIGPAPGPTRVEHVAELVLEVRGDAVVSDISGAVLGDHRGGSLKIAGAGRVKLAARQSDIWIDHIAGDVQVDVSGGELRVRDVAGRLGFEGRRAELDAEGIAGEIQVTAADGRVECRGVQADIRIDARRSDVAIFLAKAVQVRASTTEKQLLIGLPPGAGLTVRASTTDGRIQADETFGLPVTGTGREQSASGAIAGGGPEVVLEAARGDIVIRKQEAGGSPLPTP